MGSAVQVAGLLQHSTLMDSKEPSTGHTLPLGQEKPSHCFSGQGRALSPSQHLQVKPVLASFSYKLTHTYSSLVTFRLPLTPLDLWGT